MTAGVLVDLVQSVALLLLAVGFCVLGAAQVLHYRAHHRRRRDD
jgi:hypothetical protein